MEKLRQLLLEDKTIDGYYAGRAYAVKRKDLEIGLKQYKGDFFMILELSQKPA